VPDDIPVHMQKDPTAFTLGSGRDGCRTPMPWSSHEKNCGFSTSNDPYLPIPRSHVAKAVDHQEQQPDSFLHFTRHLLHWRKNQPALVCGETKVIDNDGAILAMVRRSEGQTLLCLFNMSNEPQSFRPGDYLDIHTLQDLKIKQDQTIVLPPYGCDFEGARDVPSLFAKKEPVAQSQPPVRRVG
jgi:alpha-glucosidase